MKKCGDCKYFEEFSNSIKQKEGCCYIREDVTNFDYHIRVNRNSNCKFNPERFNKKEKK